ncbi:MAG: efflux RND transporter periplasmic adaptor subunit [Planctomycetaceae bacterium]
MNASWFPTILVALFCVSLPGCAKHTEEHQVESHKITATCPESKAVTLTQRFVCQIHSQRHINVRALEIGYLEAIQVKEGQPVKEGELLFNVRPVLYKTKFEAEQAEADLAKLKLTYTEQLAQKNVVSQNEVKLQEVEVAKAKAKAMRAKAELDFAYIKAPFDGIIDQLFCQQGSLVQEGEILTTLSDNSVMWVYYNVPEKQYLNHLARSEEERASLKVELELANHEKFQYAAVLNTIEADFNNQTGTVKFRADFPNPDRILRNGQTGTILVSRVQKDAIVIPQRATFEVLDKRYVYVVDQDNVAHQREIDIQNELEDLFVIKDGLAVTDKIVLEGVRQVRDGEKVEYEERKADEVLADLKQHAE